MAEPTKRVLVPLDYVDSNPIVVGIRLNEQAQRWDLEILVGNYATREEAETEGLALRGVLEAYFDAPLDRAKI